jgi:hypothetical protein
VIFASIKPRRACADISSRDHSKAFARNSANAEHEVGNISLKLVAEGTDAPRRARPSRIRDEGRRRSWHACGLVLEAGMRSVFEAAKPQAWRSVLAASAAAAGLACAAAPALAADHTLPPPPVIRTLLPITSGASEHVSMRAGFIPYRLGASTSISFGFRIQSPPHTVPQPLIDIALALPGDLGAATSQLGLANCTPHAFYEYGLGGCPPNSLLGRATATATVPIGPALISEQVHIGLTATASESNNLEILYAAEGLTPVFSMLVFRGEVIEANPPYGEEINTFIPPIETLPEAPYASVVSMRSTIGPLGLTYYRHLHGRLVAYHPEGIDLPARCPRGGFKFAATFTFLDQATKLLHARVPCPGAHHAS